MKEINPEASARQVIARPARARRLLRGGAAGLGLAGLQAMGPSSGWLSPRIAAAQDETRLAFIAGSYESGLVRENLDRFEGQYPGLKVDFTPENDGTYTHVRKC